MKLQDVCEILEDIAPLAEAEDWDNVGLLVGDPAVDVSRVLVTIDLTPAVFAEAMEQKCQLVVAYHPPVFSPQKRALAGSILFDAARAGIAVYSPHTALDAAPGGTNDVLADLMGMTQRQPLKPSRVATAGVGVGMGRIGAIPRTTRAALFALIKSGVPVPSLLVSGPRDGRVSRVAVCAGSPGDLLGAASRAGAELVLTGEVRHHDALAAARDGVTVVCTLHSNSERGAMPAYAARISRRRLAVLVSRADRDPFEVV